MRVALREDYQLPAVEEVRRHLRNGAKSILINAPTGSGKTVMAAALMELTLQKGNRCNFVVDRISLIEQTSATLDRYDIPHGVIQADHPRQRLSERAQICSIQTLIKRGQWPEAAVDFIDEAHILSAAVKTRIQSKRAITIGLSATPFTKGLAKYFDQVVNVTTTRWLIDQKWLVPYRVFSCAEPDMTKVKVTARGEWDDGEASDAAMEIVGDAVKEYIDRGEGRKFICSGVTIAHCKELADQFLRAGINVELYTAGDRPEDRAEAVEEFRKPDSSIRGLITVTAASRGFDVSDIGCVIMCRPLRRSLAEHIQLLGRGLRIHPGKEDCIVLDLSGNMARFWHKCEGFFDHGLDKLDDGKKPKKEAAPPKELEPMKCPKCSVLHKPSPACPACGHEYPRRQTVVHIPGALKELIAGKYQSVLVRDLWPQICGAARETKPDPVTAGKYALALYRQITGDWPRNAWFDSTKPVEPTPEVRKRIKSAHIAWRHSPRRDSSAASGAQT